MKTAKLARAVAAATMLGVGSVAPASATDNIQQFGEQEVLNEGATVTGYTVTGLGPSADAIPYPVAGRLYEATVTVDAIASSRLGSLISAPCRLARRCGPIAQLRRSSPVCAQ